MTTSTLTVPSTAALHTTPELELADPVSLRILRIGAIYDMLVSAPFATPFTATAVLALMRAVHARLGIGGEVLPSFAPAHLLFVAFFGTVVTFWSIYRLRTRLREVLLIDTIGRVLFSSWMLVTLLQGGSQLLAVFLALELSFFATQAYALARDTRAGHASA